GSSHPAVIQPFRGGICARPPRCIRFRKGTRGGARLYGSTAGGGRLDASRRLVFCVGTVAEGTVGYAGAHARVERPFGPGPAPRSKSNRIARDRIRAEGDGHWRAPRENRRAAMEIIFANQARGNTRAACHGRWRVVGVAIQPLVSGLKP